MSSLHCQPRDGYIFILLPFKLYVITFELNYRVITKWTNFLKKHGLKVTQFWSDGTSPLSLLLLWEIAVNTKWFISECPCSNITWEVLWTVLKKLWKAQLLIKVLISCTSSMMLSPWLPVASLGPISDATIKFQTNQILSVLPLFNLTSTMWTGQ